MARYTEAACRLCRREGTKLFLKGDRCFSAKCGVERRAYPPGQHGQGRAHGAPDVCRVHLAATALRPSVAVALADGEATARRIREALAAGGVAPADAATGTVTDRLAQKSIGLPPPRIACTLL